MVSFALLHVPTILCHIITGLKETDDQPLTKTSEAMSQIKVEPLNLIYSITDQTEARVQRAHSSYCWDYG